MLHVETLTVGPLQENTYIIYDGQKNIAACIDPGYADPRIWQFIESHSLTLELILLTHGHVDHLAGVEDLAAHSGASITMHKGDLFLTEELDVIAPIFGFSPVSLPAIGQELSGGEKLDLGGNAIEVLHTPGHSPGSVTFAAEGQLFVGDLIFSGSIGRTDLPGGDHQQLLTSVKEKIWPYPENTLIYPGHGPRTTVGAEKRMNPFFAAA